MLRLKDPVILEPSKYNKNNTELARAQLETFPLALWLEIWGESG